MLGYMIEQIDHVGLVPFFVFNISFSMPVILSLSICSHAIVNDRTLSIVSLVLR